MCIRDRKDPGDLYYSLVLVFVIRCVGYVGDFEALALANVESTLKYHPAYGGYLTWARYPGREQCQVGSLTGAVAS